MSKKMNVAETRANIQEYMATHTDDETNVRILQEAQSVYQMWIDLAWPLAAALIEEEKYSHKDGMPDGIEGQMLRMVSLELLSQWVELFKAMRAVRALHKELLPDHYQRQCESKKGIVDDDDSEAWKDGT